MALLNGDMDGALVEATIRMLDEDELEAYLFDMLHQFRKTREPCYQLAFDLAHAHLEWRLVQRGLIWEEAYKWRWRAPATRGEPVD